MNIVTLNMENLEEGIALFNDGMYFDAHEAWEGPWFKAQNAPEKQFIQGLIMAAGALLQAQKRECRGAARLLAMSIPLLRNGIDTHPDLKLGEFIEAMAKLREKEDWCPAGMGAQKLPRIMRG